MNKIFLIGNLTRDPELTTTQTGVSMCRFGIAVNNYTADKDKDVAEFFNVVTWRNLAENCSKFLTKGNKVCVVGRLQTRQYDDRDGNKRTSVEVNADDVEFLTPRSAGNEQSSYQAPVKKQVSELTPVNDDNLPF